MEQKAVLLPRLAQQRIANLVANASSMRKQGAPGVVEAARQYLRRMDLQDFLDCDFRTALDEHTDALRRALPHGARSGLGEGWGLARKALNLLLEEAFYNRFLVVAYPELIDLGAVLEVPLDSQVARGLRDEPGGHTLPPWQRLKDLGPEESRQYQEFAAQVASRREMPRVCLDLEYWRR